FVRCDVGSQLTYRDGYVSNLLFLGRFTLQGYGGILVTSLSPDRHTHPLPNSNYFKSLSGVIRNKEESFPKNPNPISDHLSEKIEKGAIFIPIGFLLTLLLVFSSLAVEVTSRVPPSPFLTIKKPVHSLFPQIHVLPGPEQAPLGCPPKFIAEPIERELFRCCPMFRFLGLPV
ncbi:hypothetical protein BHM03_00057430, partial [Ensete ventricosum]